MITVIESKQILESDAEAIVNFVTCSGEVINFKSKTECTFIINYDGEYWSKIENNYYKLIELEDRDTTMIKEIDNDKPLERKKVIPPKDHPWRKKFNRRI